MQESVVFVTSTHNYSLNPTHSRVTPRAGHASRHAARGLALRWAVWDNDLNESKPDRTLMAGPHEFGGFVGTAVGKTACD
jgi:hypothetical protein